MAATILSNQSSTGFYKSPVCKGLMCSMFVACTAIHIPMIAHLRQYLICEIPELFNSPTQIWRLLFNRLTCVYSKDIICSALIIYYFRILERRLGSRKFASYVLSCCTMATCLEISAIMFMLHLYQDSSPVGRFLSPGLYSILFPMYVHYFMDIPRVAVTSFLGIPVTGKTITYLLGLQIGTSTPSTMMASVAGILAGILHRQNFFWVQNWFIVPNWFGNLCDKVFGWILYSNPPKENLPMGATLELQRQEEAEQWEQQYFQNRARDLRQNRGQGYSERLVGDYQQQDGVLNFFRRRRPEVQNGRLNIEAEPSEQNIQLLVDMGFDRMRAAEALRSSSNDLQAATSLLLRQ